MGAILSFIVKIVIYALSFLPTSPIQAWINCSVNTADVKSFFGYLNFFVPISEMVIFFQVVLGAYLAYLAFKKIMQVVNGLKK